MLNNEHAMEIMRLGECSNIWEDLSSKNYKTVIGGFSFNLATFCQNMGITSILTPQAKKFLNSCLYVADEDENPNHWSISELFEDRRDIQVIFDPLCGIDLDWADLEDLIVRQKNPSKYHSTDYTELRSQLETRLALFANRPLQRKLVKRLAQMQKEYDMIWVHFRHRVREFWEMAYEVCLESGNADNCGSQDSVRDLTANMLDWIFLSNTDNYYGYLSQVHRQLDEDSTLVSQMRYISRMVDKLVTAINETPSRKKRSNAYQELIGDAVNVIYGLWLSTWPENRQRTILDIPLMQEFRDNMSAADNIILGVNRQYRLDSINQSGISAESATMLLHELKQHLDATIDIWTKLMEKGYPLKEAANDMHDIVLDRLNDHIEGITVSAAGSENHTEEN